MRSYVNNALLSVVVLVIVVSSTCPGVAQSDTAGQLAQAMGVTGKLAESPDGRGGTCVAGQGMTLMLDSGGAPVLICPPKDATFNQKTESVRDAGQAEVYVRAFIHDWGEKLQLPGLPEDVPAKTSPDSLFGGWSVTLRPEPQGVPSLPAVSVILDADGAVRAIGVVRSSGDVPVEPKLTRDDARNVLVQHRGLSGQYEFERAELSVWPANDGRPALTWTIVLRNTADPADRKGGFIDAITGEVLGVTDPGGGGVPPTKPEARHGQPLLYALATLAVLLVIFLVVKLRKR